MHLPSITPEMIQQRMTTAWKLGNICYFEYAFKGCRKFMNEYDYLSHYMTADQVYRILDRV